MFLNNFSYQTHKQRLRGVFCVSIPTTHTTVCSLLFFVVPPQRKWIQSFPFPSVQPCTSATFILLQRSRIRDTEFSRMMFMFTILPYTFPIPLLEIRTVTYYYRVRATFTKHTSEHGVRVLGCRSTEGRSASAPRSKVRRSGGASSRRLM